MSLKKRRNDEIVERNMKLVKLSLNVVRKINVSLKLLTRVPSKISKELAAKKEEKKHICGVNFSRDEKRTEKRREKEEEKAENRWGPRRSDTRNQFRRCRYFEPLFTIESNSTG